MGCAMRLVERRIGKPLGDGVIKFLGDEAQVGVGGVVYCTVDETTGMERVGECVTHLLFDVVVLLWGHFASCDV